MYLNTIILKVFFYKTVIILSLNYEHKTSLENNMYKYCKNIIFYRSTYA